MAGDLSALPDRQWPDEAAAKRAAVAARMCYFCQVPLGQDGTAANYCVKCRCYWHDDGGRICQLGTWVTADGYIVGYGDIHARLWISGLLPIGMGIMSDRSSAWYAVPANAERRKARMRAYNWALAELGRRHVDERGQLYRDGVGSGLTATSAQSFALRQLRDRHRVQFNGIYQERLEGKL